MGVQFFPPVPEGVKLDGRVWYAKVKQPCLFIALGPPLISCHMHFTPQGGRPHEDEDCPYCPQQTEKKAWVPAVSWQVVKGVDRYDWQKGPVELTNHALFDWDDSMIGCMTWAIRVGTTAKGKVVLEPYCDQKISYPNPMPEVFDCLPYLHRVWGFTNRKGHLMRKLGDVIPMKPGPRKLG